MLLPLNLPALLDLPVLFLLDDRYGEARPVRVVQKVATVESAREQQSSDCNKLALWRELVLALEARAYEGDVGAASVCSMVTSLKGARVSPSFFRLLDAIGRIGLDRYGELPSEGSMLPFLLRPWFRPCVMLRY